MNQTPLLLIDEAIAALASASEALNLAKQQLQAQEARTTDSPAEARVRKLSDLSFLERLEIAKLIAEGNHTQTEIGLMFGVGSWVVSQVKAAFAETPGAEDDPQFSKYTRSKKQKDLSLE